MKKSRFTEQQIGHAVAQVQAGVPIQEVCRKLGISQQTFYRWKKKYGAMAPSEIKRLKQLEDETGFVRDVNEGGESRCDSRAASSTG